MRVTAFLVLLLGCGGAASSRPATEPAVHTPDPQLRVAELGTCALEGGAAIRDCRVAYRTFGTLNAARDNAVLVPTWFTGTSRDLAALIPDRFVDTSRFFVVLVDAFANGASSSPSNSAAQPRLQFPGFGVRDLVAAQRRLLTETLGIRHLHAVLGISMGGMQAIQWSVSYPDDVDRVVAMAGSPQATAQDLLLWNAELHAIVHDVAYRDGQYAGHPPLRTAVDVLELTLFTPTYRATHTTPAELPALLSRAENSASTDWNDRRRQVEAMLAHDVAAPYGGSLDAAASRVRAKSLYLVAARDQVVNPLPAQAFGAKVGAAVEVSDSECGHLAVQVCETDAAAARVRAFLAQ